eukprot:TCONS_00004574-protein
MEIDMGEHASILYGTHYPNKIFVGCLPARITAASLGEYFGCFGEVIEAKVVLDDAKKSKRFGFVSFSRATDAKTVLSAGDFYMLGKRIVVGPAVKREFKERVADESVKIVMAQEAVIEHEMRRSNEHRQSNDVYNPPRRFVYRPLKQEKDDDNMETKTLTDYQQDDVKPPCNDAIALPTPPQQTSQRPLPSNNGAFYYPQQPWHQPLLFFDPNSGFFYH